jgi:hypothetical protein
MKRSYPPRQETIAFLPLRSRCNHPAGGRAAPWPAVLSAGVPAVGGLCPAQGVGDLGLGDAGGEQGGRGQAALFQGGDVASWADATGLREEVDVVMAGILPMARSITLSGGTR